MIDSFYLGESGMTDENYDNNTLSFTPISNGTQVSHFKILGLIGSGEMGEVYLVEDGSLDRPTALKFLHKQYSNNPELRERFKREALAATRLNHANTVTVFEVGEYDDRPFLAMQYVEGVSLRDRLAQGKMELDEALAIGVGICNGLAEAHKQGIVHGAIKPTNILIDKDGRPKIADFGLTCGYAAGDLAETASTIGTVEYLSPEQVLGEKVDERSDLFSVAVVLYEMIAGRKPFTGDDKQAILHAIVNTPHDPMSRYKSGLTQALNSLIGKALSKEPELRYQRADDLAADLKRAGYDIGSGKFADSFLERPAKSAFRRIVPRLLGTAAVVAVIFGLVVSMNVALKRKVKDMLGINSLPSRRHLVVLPFESLGDPPISQDYCEGLLETLTSKVTEMEQFQGSLRVVPASEVRQLKIPSASEATRTFDVTLAVTGSLQRHGDMVRMTMNLIDTKSKRQLQSLLIDDSLDSIQRLQDSLVVELASMLEVQLHSQGGRRAFAATTDSSRAYDYYLSGLGQLRHYDGTERIDSAVTLFRRAIRTDTSFALGYAGLSEAYWHRYLNTHEPRWADSAMMKCNLALDLNHYLAEVHVALGVMFKGMGKYDKAIKAFNHALEINPASRYDAGGSSLGFDGQPVATYTYRYLAQAYEASNHIEQAEEAYKKVIELQPDFWGGYNDLGLFYSNSGRADEAAEQLAKAVATEPTGYRAWNDIGGLYYYINRFDMAQQMWRKSVDMSPNYAACSNLGSMYYFAGQFDSAAAMYSMALGLEDHDYRLWGNLASAYGQIDTCEAQAAAANREAIKRGEKIREVNPNDAVLLSELAMFYLNDGYQSRALLYTEEALALAPSNNDVLVSAGFVYEKIGDRKRAMELIGGAIRRGFPREALEGLPELERLFADAHFDSLIENGQ